MEKMIWVDRGNNKVLGLHSQATSYIKDE